MNIWQQTVNEKLLETMRLCGCDKKYLNGVASDFECFKEACRIYPYLVGNAVAEDFFCRVKYLVKYVNDDQICESNAATLWRRYNRIFDGEEYPEEQLALTNFDKRLYFTVCFDHISNCDEKEKIMSDCACLNEMVDRFDFKNVFELCEALKSKDIISIYADFCDGGFQAPNIYRADCVYEKIKNGEKYNKTEYNLLISQIICQYASQNKCRKIQLYLNCGGNYDYIKDLVSYLSRYRLGARIFILTPSISSPENIADVCRASTDECFVTPLLVADKNDPSTNIADLAQHLARIYPLGYVLMT